MSAIDDLADRIDRLLLKHDEALRTQALLAQQLEAMTAERDGLRQRLGAVRQRLDGLLARWPHDAAAGETSVSRALGGGLDGLTTPGLDGGDPGAGADGDTPGDVVPSDRAVARRAAALPDALSVPADDAAPDGASPVTVTVATDVVDDDRMRPSALLPTRVEVPEDDPDGPAAMAVDSSPADGAAPAASPTPASRRRAFR